MSKHDVFVGLLEEHKRILYSVARAYCKDPGQRDDLVSDIIVAAWRSFDRFDGRNRFSTWMYRIALNTAISFYRRDRRRLDRAGTTGDEFLNVAAPIALEGDGRMETLWGLIGELDELDRSLMILYLDDEPYEAIAQTLGITTTNVATKISRIKERFRRRLAAPGKQTEGKQ